MIINQEAVDLYSKMFEENPSLQIIKESAHAYLNTELLKKYVDFIVKLKDELPFNNYFHDLFRGLIYLNEKDYYCKLFYKLYFNCTDDRYYDHYLSSLLNNLFKNECLDHNFYEIHRFIIEKNPDVEPEIRKLSLKKLGLESFQ